MGETIERKNEIGVSMYRFVVNKVYMELLLNLEYGTQKINEIAKKHNISYFHLTTVLTEMQKEGIITRTLIPKSNAYDIALTKKGNRIVQELSRLKNAIEEVKVKGKNNEPEGQGGQDE